jgi:hydrogenase maturation protease
MKHSSPPPVTVACSGNWLLGHDRIGPRVLDMIDGRYEWAIDICDLGTSALALLDHLRAQELLLVVDACVGKGQPGEVMVETPDLGAALGRETSIHQIGPLEALVVAGHLEPEKLPQRTRLVLVETAGLDEAAEAAACERVVEILDSEILGWVEGMTKGRMPWQSKLSCNASKA